MNRLLATCGLRFPTAQQEHEFWKDYVFRFHKLIVGIAVLGGAFYYAFFVWDKIIDPNRWEYTHGVRAIVFAIILTLSALMLVHRLHRHVEGLVTAATCAAAVGLCWIYAHLENGYDYGASGILLVVMFASCLLPVRMPYFLAFSGVTVLSFTIGHFFATGINPGMAIVNGMLVGCAIVWGILAVAWRESTARGRFVLHDQLARSRARVEELLHSMLPVEIVKRIQDGETSIADSYGEVSIVFADLVGFTELARKISPNHLVEILNSMFSRFDALAEQHGIDRIKTIGDAYMAVGGLATGFPPHDHACRAADFALAIQAVAASIADEMGFPIKVRVGLHVGPIVAGVIGTKRPAFDCWGEAVNLANRLETAAHPGAILISESAYWRLRDTFETEVWEDVDLKGIGMTRVFALRGRVEMRAVG